MTKPKLQMPKTARRALLTDFLKTRRARLSPADFGFEDNGLPRRTKGLRRGEAAQLAGVSTEWYTLFEMGRERAMTQRIIERVARALQLDGAERDYLFDLVRAEPPPEAVAKLHPAIDYALDQVADGAFSLCDPWLTRLRANRVFQSLFLLEEEDDWLTHNVLWRLFKVPHTRRLAGTNWRETVRKNVGLFRRALARDPLNQTAHAIIRALRGDADFDALWSAHDVYSLEMYSNDGMKSPDVVQHPRHGRLTVYTLMLEIPAWRGAHVRYIAPADAKTVAIFREVRETLSRRE